MLYPALRALVGLALSTTFASPSPPDTLFPPSERQVFNLVFVDSTAGELVFETLGPTTWEKKPALHFRATVRTTKFFWMIYPYLETVDLYYDRDRNLPLFVDVNVRDRKKTQHTQIRLDEVTLKGEELEDSTEPGEPPHHRRKAWSMTPGAQSLFSILHFLRTKPLEPATTVSFPVSHDEKNTTFEADVVRKERVEALGEERESFLVRVRKNFASFYSNVRTEPEMWFSTDARHRLLRFELPHRFGRVTGVLKSEKL